MGMSIGLVRLAMRGPARMGDASRAINRRVGHEGFQIDDLAPGAAALNCISRQHSYAGAVIATILQTLQAVDETPGNGFRTCDRNNSAHTLPPFG